MGIKKIILLLVCGLFLSPPTLFSQQSNQWMLGWLGKADFNSGSLQYSIYGDTIFITQTTAGVCDTNGQMIFWTNGGAVFQNNRDTMLNGLLPHTPLSQLFTPSGLNIMQGAIVVPTPGAPNKYYLFYASQEYDNSLPGFPVTANVYSSQIDMSLNGGLGAVTNSGVFLEDSIYLGFLEAVKHANGRDWWIISHQRVGDTFLVWLITPNGISSTIRVQGGFNIWDEFLVQLDVSNDGSKICQSYSTTSPVIPNYINVLDFDRCTGLVSNSITASFNDSSMFGAYCQFSPSGRYVYSADGWFIYQFDLQAPNFQNSKVLIDTYNGTFAPFEADMAQLARAPDGKIYCSSRNGNYSLHVINDPDSAGLACNFVQNQFYPLNSLNIMAVPNMPNYELGKLVGSVCDTLVGLDESLGKEFGFSIYPNPNNGDFSISFSQNFTEPIEIMITDAIGKTLYKNSISIPSSSFQLNLNLKSGIYYCSVISDSAIKTRKFLVY
jgi:type IX secretion system substrate protein